MKRDICSFAFAFSCAGVLACPLAGYAQNKPEPPPIWRQGMAETQAESKLSPTRAS